MNYRKGLSVLIVRISGRLMSMNKKSQRPKLGGRIREAASKEIGDAIRLAGRGKHFTELQKFLELYYRARAEVETIKSTGKTSVQSTWPDAKNLPKKFVSVHHGSFERLAIFYEEKFCKAFLMALRAGNGKEVCDIGNAIVFLMEFKPYCDELRLAILQLKFTLDNCQQRITLRQVAEHIGLDVKSDDGFSQLRRLCKELNFPLRPSRQITAKS